MRIVYITHWRIPSEKTMSPLIMRTCTELAARGHSVELWIPKRKNREFIGVDPHEYHEVQHNFKIVALPILDPMGILPGKAAFVFLVFCFNIAVLFHYLFSRTRSQTVFYAHDFRDALLLCLMRVTIFFEIHDFYLSSIGFVNRNVHRAAGLIVTNHIKIQNIIDTYDIDVSKIIHSPNGVDTSKFDLSVSRGEARDKLQLPHNKKIAVYTGHLFDWKGVDTIIDASLLLPDIQIYVVGGTDDDIKIYQQKCQQKGSTIIIIGRKLHREIPFWLRAADMLLLTNSAKFAASYYETSPVKLFEYMCSRTPIVASDLPSVRNILNETMATFYEADNPRSLANAMQSVLTSAQSVEKAQYARTVVAQYDWRVRMDAVNEFLTTRVAPRT